MINPIGNTYSTHYQLAKTTKAISEISDIVSDRLIITKEGQMYFDYSDNERIEIKSISKVYKIDKEYENVDTTLEVSYDEIFDIDGNTLDKCYINTSVFDMNGNLGIIVNKDDEHKKCIIHVITMSNRSFNIYELSYLDFMNLNKEDLDPKGMYLLDNGMLFMSGTMYGNDTIIVDEFPKNPVLNTLYVQKDTKESKMYTENGWEEIQDGLIDLTSDEVTELVSSIFEE